MIKIDKQLHISVGGNRRATKWQEQVIWWSEFISRLATPVRSPETLAEYLRLPKSKQDDLKDVGGFVGGTLRDGIRKATNVIGRELITLDMDNIPPGETDDTLKKIEALGCAYVVYSTRKHEPYKPRLRAVIPLDRMVTADEYEPIARKLASLIGIEMCDPTTFEASRLMYWPSVSSDSQYVYRYADRPFLSADGTLKMYTDWRNYAEWPQVPGVSIQKQLADKQADPTSKGGVVGAFCKTYDVYRAMDELIPGRYEPCALGDNRYTYTGGSTAGGAVVYENGAFLYSHHATDPAGGKLCNSFDLVRYHLYGAMDDDAKPGTPVNKLPSYLEMTKRALADEHVAAVLTSERYEAATADFSIPVTETPVENWVTRLALSQSGAPARTIDNILIIMDNDPLLKDKVAYDEFSRRCLAMGELPWNPATAKRTWSDTDDAGMRHYLEKVYGITGTEKIMDAVNLAMHKNLINEPKDYLSGLEWDGIKRLDTLLVDYFGAADTPYTRAVIRKSLCAAVARIMTPGVKFDTMTIIHGPQGIGKSTFLSMLGKDWYTDSLTSFEGKEAYEIIQGAWIVEIGELKGMAKADDEAIRLFLSKKEDKYREAYGRRPVSYPRSCVFFGTTNVAEFLRDYTGNRRFWPVDTALQKPTKSIFNDFPDEVDQVWAEAKARWQAGETLYLAGELEHEAKLQQELHRESSAKEGMIRDFVERMIPVDWDKRDIATRRLYWSMQDGSTAQLKPRDRICAVEVYVECFGGDVKFMKRTDSIEINAVLSTLTGWKRVSTCRMGPYGVQKGFIKADIL